MKNKGYQFEKDFANYKGWTRAHSNFSHVESGDIIDKNGNHYQLKTKDGQMSIIGDRKPANPLETLHDRIDRELAENFVVGIEKGKKWEIFTFTKENFKKILAENSNFWKVQEMSEKGKYHFRFSFSLSKGSYFQLRKFSEKHEKVLKTLDK